MLDAVVAAAFQDVQEAGDIAGDVDVGVFGGVADAGLGGKMHDPLGLVLGEGGLDRSAIGEISGDMGVAGQRQQPIQPRLFQSRVVIVVEVVEADDLLAAGQQDLGNVGADEAGSATN